MTAVIRRFSVPHMNEPTLKCKHVLDKSLVQTYFGLRWGTILLAAQFPISLALGGYLIFGLGLRDSMSAYYTTGLRDWYVGVLFALATCLFLYKGIRPLEGRLLNLAASFAVGVAIFPVDWIPAWWIFGNGLRPHNLCAYAFFLTGAAACWPLLGGCRWSFSLAVHFGSAVSRRA